MTGFRRWAGPVASHAAAIIALAVLLGPVVLVIVASWHQLLPVFREAGQMPVIGRQLRNSLVLAGGVAVVCGLVAPGAGYALSLRDLPFRRLWTTLTATLAVLPVTILLIPGALGVAAVNLRDSLWGVGALHLALTLPASIWIMRNAFIHLPQDLIEAARFDGAAPYRVYRAVALPFVRSARLVVLAVAFAISWGEYTIASVLLVRDSSQTLAAAVASLTREGVPWAHLIPRIAWGALPALILWLTVQLRIARWTGLDRLLAERTR